MQWHIELGLISVFCIAKWSHSQVCQLRESTINIFSDLEKVFNVLGS
jgi:hypothetical protein